jgi:glutamate/tyrosine decarboxylase-like PLP-dependent enzyme
MHPTPDEASLLERTAELAIRFRRSLPERPVGRPAAADALRAALAAPLPERGEDPRAVVEALARAADPGLVASAGPRYFGFVTGGALPAALAGDWLASAWDQNGWSWAASPAAAVVEEAAGGWLRELLGLPTQASVGFTTGATLASFTGLAAGRHALLRRQGWDVEEDGLAGAPPLPIVAGEEAHATIFAALQMLGLGRARAVRVACDAQGRMQPDALRAALAAAGAPALVCAQAGNVNTGAFDPLEPIADAVREHRGWLHVDGAFGLWAAASPALRPLVRGVERADSWTTDAHKWLNVPYDSGLVFVRDPDAHRAAVSHGAAYYVSAAGGERDNHHFVPESSRRARGFAVWAALRSLGRQGVAELVERCCALARRFAERLGAAPGVEIPNDVVLNQVLVRFSPPAGGDRDAWTREVIRRIQEDGTCWAGGTTWRGRTALRISVSNATTTEADVDRSAAAILRCARAA